MYIPIDRDNIAMWAALVGLCELAQKGRNGGLEVTQGLQKSHFTPIISLGFYELLSFSP